MTQRIISPWILLLAALSALLLTVGARASAPALGDMQTGSLLMRMGQGYVPATLLNTDVSISVSGLVARVSVMQEFRNSGSEWVEGVYVFPLPDKAAVDQMRLYIGDRFIEGEIREKAQARKDYEQARRDGKKASLVEQQRANLFTTSVANIAPGETVIVEFEYFEDIAMDDGIFSLRFPLTLTPRYMPEKASADPQGNGMPVGGPAAEDARLISPPMLAASAGHRVSILAEVNAGTPLEIIASRYHPVHVSSDKGRYLVTLAGARVPMDNDFELLWRPVPSASPRALLFEETVAGDAHYLLMVMPPETGNAPAAPMPRELIFVIDTSGSMHGASIEQARLALQRALSMLRPGDRFNVVEFNSRTSPLFPDCVAATPRNIDSARRFVDQLQAQGGTEMRPALEFALRSPTQPSHLRQIVFITDGSVGNEDDLFSLIERRLGDARLFTVGIGSAPNSWFMRKSAEAGRGTFTVIGASHEVEEKMHRLFRKLEHPQVTSIAIEWPSGVLIDAYPATVPDLYLGEPISVRAKVSGGFLPGATVRVSGDSPAGAWYHDLPVAVDQQSAGIGALWARARIASLLDEERRGADKAETRGAIIATAILHQLVSKYTSLVAVDKTPARLAGDPLSSERVPNLAPHGQSSLAIIGLPATATGAPIMRLQGAVSVFLALLLLTVVWHRRRRSHGRVA
jgi:Ca-activated chloride channel family protein